MFIPSYLLCRHGIFYFRRAVPATLRECIGKREILLSLRTRNPREALQSARTIAIKVESLFRGAMMGNENKNTAKTGWAVEIKPDGTRKLEMTPEDYTVMADDQIEKVWDRFESTTLPVALNTPPDDSSHTTVSTLITMFVTHWEAEHSGQKMASGNMTKLRRLIEMLGPDMLASSISYEQAEYVRSTLAKIPNNSTGYRGLTVSQIVASSQKEDIERLGTKTRNDHLELYSNLFSFAVKRGAVTSVHIDPFDGVRVIQNAKERIKKSRKAFGRSQLKLIFSTSLHTKPDTSMPYRYWTPLLALFTGARRGELSALRLEDIRKIDDVWVIDFNENSSDKRAKTANGFRCTPIHPTLIKYGFLSYVEDLRITKSGYFQT